MKVKIETDKLQYLINIVTSAIHPKTPWIDIHNFLNSVQGALEIVDEKDEKCDKEKCDKDSKF